VSLFGIIALKWPFKSKDVNGVIATLRRYRHTLSAAFTVDQTSLISARPLFSPNSRLPRTLPSIHTSMSTTRDATPKPRLLSAKK